MKTDLKSNQTDKEMRRQKPPLYEYQPVTAVWEITFACNMRCKHCGSGCDTFLPDELSTEEALNLCDDIGKMGLRYLTLSGGEPFVRKDWHWLAARLRANNVIPVVISNGWFIDETIIDLAFEAGVSNIAVSLDGLKQNHDWIRKRGSFERTVHALDLMRRKNMSSSVVTAVNNKNIGELPSLRDLLIELKVDSWQVQIAVAMGNLLQNEELIIRPQQVDTIIDFAYATNQEEKIKVYLADCVGYYNLKEVEIRRMHSPDPNYRGFFNGCPAGKNAFGIRCNGNITGCTSIRDDAYIEANVRDIPLPQLWKREDAFAWNRSLSKADLNGFCGQCQYGAWCLGGCTNLKITMSKSLYENRYCSFLNAAQKIFAEAAAITDPAVLSNKGKAFCENGDYQFAQACFARGLELVPTDTEILNYLGFIHFQMEDYKTSLDFNRRSLTIDPTSAYALKGMGNCLVKLGQIDKGITFLKKSAESATVDFTDPFYDLAVVYYDNRRYAEGIRILDAAMQRSQAFAEQSKPLYEMLQTACSQTPV